MDALNTTMLVALVIFVGLDALFLRGVQHGGKIPADAKGAAFQAGFASPPQLDLYLRTPSYRDGKYQKSPFQMLEPK